MSKNILCSSVKFSAKESIFFLTAKEKHKKVWQSAFYAVSLQLKNARLGGASAIQASLIAFGLHEPCRR
jgi:hypothetical protein